MTLVLGDSALRLLVLLVEEVLDHVLRTVHKATERSPVLAMLADPLQEHESLAVRDLLPVQAGLEVVVPPLTALLCVSGAVLTGDLDPVDLGLVGISADQSLESFVLGGGPRPSLLAWAVSALVHGAEACHDGGGTVEGGVDDEDNSGTGAHQVVWQTWCWWQSESLERWRRCGRWQCLSRDQRVWLWATVQRVRKMYCREC